MKFKRKTIDKTVSSLLVTVLLLFMLFPFVVMISTMLKPEKEIYSIPPRWIPKKWMWANLIQVWREFSLITYFKNSFIIAIGTTVLNTALSIPAAYAIARLRFKGRKALFFLYLVVQMFSPVIVVISLFKILANTGLIDTYIGLIVVNTVFTLAFAIWMMAGYFQSIPKEIEEASLIDGCTRTQTIPRIILPIASPGVVVVMIYTFITAWNEFLFALSFLQSTEKLPLTIGLYNFVGRWTTQWGFLSSASFIAIIPILVLFYLIEKKLIAGLTGGALKQ